MLRFAFSPTSDINIGDLRVAILNYIVSKQRGEGLIVRIEDMDKERNIEQKEEEMLGILGLFGIEYSHVVHQSQNFRFHAAMALQLLHEAKAFNCFCSPQWLEKKREEAKNNNEAYKYDDACASLPAELVIDNENPFTVRIKKPQEPIIIKDYINGEMILKPQDVESFIIMSENKRPTYSFACGIDDMLSDISLVICDEEHLSDAPKEDWIRTLLGYQKKIEYAHLPLMQDGTSSVKWLLEEGYLPSAIVNYLISTVNKPPKDIFTMQEALEWFSLENISKSPARFDINMLKQLNREHLMMLDAKELSRYVGFADEEIGKLAKVYLEESSTTKELRSKIGAIFALKDIPEELRESSAVIADIIKKAPCFDRYEEFEKHVMQESGIKGENLLKSIRLLLTGSEHGPDIAAIYQCVKNYIGEIVK
ncbi:MAG: glutamate--tRNA ligase [Sulfurimonas sp.]|uniref:glutamate--tRNA ligase n=1 Tax=Sulfurimonas sp. TaxID=2022749 RepID=UPI0026256DB7|nr:glutamate--tRNA ligase [Sulfurimonas sp.]MDD2652595.1 glutamate--tRNA ligase [Sulfurimonas sp.]MDD3450737.1 glutamate--tRNA ligase [Sulfurimonas sp.]